MASTSDAGTIPPLPPGIQTTILSHLFPPSIPLPQQLLSKQLLQRHLYLPPSPEDVDAWLSPLPDAGLSGKLERLAGVGWIVEGVQYGSDGESVLAVVRVREEGGGSGVGVGVLFEFEGGGDGRGWTYLSVGIPPALNWVDSPASLSNATSATSATNEIDADEPTGETNRIHLDSSLPADDSAPEGYWSGFSPPASPRPSHETPAEGGEEDYWASYDKAFTPAGGVTPATQQSPARPHSDLPDVQSHADGDRTPPGRHDSGDGLLRARMEMKIASLLSRLWAGYEPTLDPESRALTYLSLARSVQSGTSGVGRNGGGEGGVREQLEMLFEIYGVLEKNPLLAEEGFQRLVEGSLSSKREGFGEGNRQDSSAQLNYWE